MTNPAVEKFYESIQGIGERAQRGVEAIEMEISRQEEQLRQLKSALADAQRILYTIDPTKKPAPKPRRGKPRDRSNGAAPTVSEAKLGDLMGWLNQHYGGTGNTFSGPEILADEKFDLMSEPTLRNALEHLHDREQIALDSISPTRRKNYRLVRA